MYKTITVFKPSEVLDYYADINKIARQYPKELGFVAKTHLKEVLLASIDSVIVGFVNFRVRKDGWATINEIAVHRDYQRQGVAKRLIFSILHPTQLKCTVDNPANDFYRHLNFKLIGTVNGRVRALNVWQSPVKFIQVAGNNPNLSIVCKNAGVGYGVRHDNKAYSQPQMLDINWKKYDWGMYLEVVKKYKPTMAMVADYIHPSQRDVMLQQVNDLRQLGVLNIMVCPKFDEAVIDIPDDCIVAISIPSSYAGFLPPSETLIGRRLHLLGGSPKKQKAYILEHPKLRIVSVDGNSYVGRPSIFTGEKWYYKKELNGTIPIYTRTARSARNWALMLQFLFDTQP